MNRNHAYGRLWVMIMVGALSVQVARADVGPSRAGFGRPVFPYCQIVDRYPDPLHGANLTGALSGSVDDAERIGLIETSVWTEFGYFRTRRGDLAVSSEAHIWLSTRSGGLDLPDTWLHAWLRLRWDIRSYNGFTLRLEIDPGFYAAAETLSDGFNLPFAAYGIQSFGDRFSGFFGLKVRPGERRLIEPATGLRLSPTDALVFDIGYPDMRMLLRITSTVTMLAGTQWNRLYEFAIDDTRERLRYRETRLYGAVRVAMDRVWHWEIRGGVLAGREIGFKRGGDRQVEGVPFLTIGLGGTF